MLAQRAKAGIRELRPSATKFYASCRLCIEAVSFETCARGNPHCPDPGKPESFQFEPWRL